MSSLLVTTAKGQFKIALDSDRAPKTCAYFKELAESGWLTDACIFRIVTQANDQSSGSGYINVVQIGTTSTLDEKRDKIDHESTNLSGLKHQKWTVSAARYEPGSLYKSFFICMEDEPHLDFGGMRQPDEQGFAAFGKISAGYHIVDSIFACGEPNEILTEPIKIGSVSVV